MASHTPPAPAQTTAAAATPAIPAHLDLPSSLSIRTTPHAGRSIFSDAAFAPGSNLISTAPLISVLDNRNLGLRCSGCFVAEEEMSEGSMARCSVCRVVQYCSPRCQKQDWDAHKNECKALIVYSQARRKSGVKGMEIMPDTPIRALGRLLWAKLKNGERYWKEVCSMQSHRTTVSAAQTEAYFQLSVSLASYVGQEVLTKTIDTSPDLLDLCSRFISNSFSLTTPHLSNIGVSISPLAALLNHSCTPNAVVVFPSRPTPSSPRFMRIIAISPIKEGDEVLTSYVDLGLTRRARRKELEERYGFECDCKLCELGKGVELSGKGWVDPRESLECKDEKCGGVLAMPGTETTAEEVDSACCKCGLVKSVHMGGLRRTLQEGEDALAKASSEQYDDPAGCAQDLAGATFALTLSSFSPSSHPLLPLLQTRLAALLHAHDWITALRVAHESWKGVVRVYPVGHPTRAIAACAIAKLMAIQRDESDDQAYWEDTSALEEGMRVMVAALKEVEIGFGKEGVLRSEMRGLIKNAEEGRELAWMTRGAIAQKGGQ